MDDLKARNKLLQEQQTTSNPGPYSTPSLYLDTSGEHGGPGGDCFYDNSYNDELNDVVPDNLNSTFNSTFNNRYGQFLHHQSHVFGLNFKGNRRRLGLQTLYSIGKHSVSREEHFKHIISGRVSFKISCTKSRMIPGSGLSYIIIINDGAWTKIIVTVRMTNIFSKYF